MFAHTTGDDKVGPGPGKLVTRRRRESSDAGLAKDASIGSVIGKGERNIVGRKEGAKVINEAIVGEMFSAQSFGGC